MNVGRKTTMSALRAPVRKLLATIMLLMFVTIAPLHGEEDSPFADFFGSSVDFRGETLSYTDFKDGSAEVAVGSQALGVSYKGLSLRHRISSYRWRDEEAIAFSDGSSEPWGELHDLSLSYLTGYPIREGLILIGRIRANTGFERQISRSFGAGMELSLLRQFSEKWSASIGVGGGYHPLRSRVLPALSLRYDDAEDSGFSAAVGMPTHLRYRISDNLLADIGVSLASGTYRLKDNSPVSEKGYFRHRAIAPGAGLVYKPTDEFTLSAGALYYFDRQWRIYDRDRSRISSKRLDSGPGFTISASWNF